jgi:Holliday junction resolvase-like predicted endonuclease
MSITAELRFGKRYEEVAARLYAEKEWPGCTIAPCATYADVDYAVMTPEKGLVALIEIKTRRCTSEKYDSTIVSLRKHHTGRYAKEFLKVKTPCVVIFTDTAAVFSLHEVPDSVEPITRYDRPGQTVDHAHYKHSRLEFRPELHAAIMSEVAEEQGI